MREKCSCKSGRKNIENRKPRFGIVSLPSLGSLAGAPWPAVAMGDCISDYQPLLAPFGVEAYDAGALGKGFHY